ncbi:MAG: hypothetical protein FJ216_11210 [Ignavibacteria bacterium]|nr:hypothetical protein [Ignavibacteria bacterium]
MYHKISDFLEDWKYESGATMKILDSLTDKSLGQKVSKEGRTLGYLAWHLAVTIGEMADKAGLKVKAPAEDSDSPASASKIKEEYKMAFKSLESEVKAKWKDGMLNDEINMYGEPWRRGMVLDSLIRHQIHHRGQMTVLMRQAGLKVPGVYGPSREEWKQLGMPEMK